MVSLLDRGNDVEEADGWRTYPVDESTMDGLQLEFDKGRLSNLEELIGLLESDSDEESDPESDDDGATALLNRIHRSIGIRAAVLDRLREMVADGSVTSRGELVAAASDVAFQETKKSERQRVVPFGARVSELCQPVRTMTPSSFSVTFIVTRWFPLKFDGTKNDDYGS